jgi:hypothetical protein
MAVTPLPYRFVNGVSTLDATTTNANNDALFAGLSNVDNTQIGPNGIFASQIIPTTLVQATFGGSQPYTFNSFVNSNAGFQQNGSPILRFNSSLNNLAVGTRTLSVATGGGNLAVGYGALEVNTSGVSNTAVGYGALAPNLTGSCNVAIGQNAGGGFNGVSNSVLIGYLAFPAANTDTNEVAIGYYCVGNGSNTVTLGGAGMTGVWGATYHTVSDGTLKTNIATTRYGLGAVMALQPRDFVWKRNNKADIGFIAQEVNDILPETVVTGSDGLLSLNYSGIIPVLVRAIQQQQEQIELLKTQLVK